MKYYIAVKDRIIVGRMQNSASGGFFVKKLLSGTSLFNLWKLLKEGFYSASGVFSVCVAVRVYYA